MIIWNHIFPQRSMDVQMFNALLREKKNRDTTFADPMARKELMNTFKTYVDFETSGMQVGNERESGAMLAADMAYRIDKLLDHMMMDIEFEI